jgi:hypothetical protein
MNPLESMAAGLAGNQQFLNMTLADFSDADMLVRPCPGANHTAWQLGHLIAAESKMISGLNLGKMPELPAGFAEKFSKETSTKDDAAFFPKKAQLMDQFAKTRGGAIAWVKSLSPADLDKPGPKGMEQMCPTVGSLIGLLPVHTAMHIGQFQVIRRKLGKPILF